MTAPAGTPAFIAGLLRPDAYPHPAPAPRLIETHISWVILAGDHAYKIKKPLDLGFLDFGTPERRLACCQEEIRLNRRLAPDIYLDVAPITGSATAPRMGGDGPALEWAVHMRAFPADATLDRTGVTEARIDAIADRVARFHAEIARAPAVGPWGSAEAVRAPVTQNFDQIRALYAGAGLAPPVVLAALEAWSRSEGERLAGHFAARLADGFVRECHGDLHLGNIAWVDEAPLIFDAIEFNPALRHIDVISEIAFLTMDLHHRGRSGLAWRALNRYLENTGDYAGLAALPYYQTYRAMVRAKVAAFRAAQTGAEFAECAGHLALAERFTRARVPELILMHGVSGSGKSWWSQHLLQRLGAIRLRSDVERKRLFGLAPLADSRAAGQPEAGIYGAEASARTLDRLLELAEGLLALGGPVIVDATFIRRDWRAPFAALAERLATRWRIVALDTSVEILRARVAERLTRGNDASEAGLAVLEAQLAAREPFDATEAAHVIEIDAGPDADIEAVLERLTTPPA